MEYHEKKLHILRQILFWTGIPLLILIAIYNYNEASFLYWESNQYKESDLTKLMDERAKPIVLLGGNKKAVLFIHGLGGSPAVFEYYAGLAAKDKYDVFVPLLPGMGTEPSDILDQTFSGWYSFIQSLYLKYRKNYKEFYVVGVSMGGSLALKIAKNFTQHETPGLAPTAVAVISAPVFINNLFELGIVPHPETYFARLIGLFTDRIPGETFPNATNTDGTENWVGYRWVFPQQIQSMKMGLKRLKDNLFKIKMPVFIVHASGDPVVDERNMDYIARHIASSNKTALLLHPKASGISLHYLTLLYETRGEVYEGIFGFFKNLKK
ncbi:MAG: hypothetical protein A2Y33_13665 [Spirochaetes bacterium GWF1_51_8]|nr:MAG: hypothetical protein A2Y33_13665 [Spirochaetes bacterium GWF1_51_8]